jgi:hypothetical protein
MIKRFKYWLAKQIVKKIFISVTEDDILTVVGKRMYRHGFEVTPQEAHSIVSGAKGLQNLETWKIIIDDTRFMLNKQIFDKAQTADDLLFARGGLWALEVLEKKVRNLSKLR